MMLRLAVAAVAFAGGALATLNSSSAARNPVLTNTTSNKNGPILYYNGSGPVPPYNETSPPPQPLPSFNTSQLEDAFFQEIVAIVNGTGFSDNCTKCIAATEVVHLAAITQSVDTVTDLLIRACQANAFPAYAAAAFASTCQSAYLGVGGLGAYYAQLFAKMSLATGDFQAFCFYNYKVCTRPPVIKINETQWFTPKPASKMSAPSPSGNNISVLHLSDWHLDPRYNIGSEANCSQSLCCRPYATNTKLHTGVGNASIPASRFGYFYCDTPADLGLSTFSTMPSFVNMSSIAFTIFTGDIVSHDADDQLSRAYVEYEEEVTYQTFKAQLGDIPIYATLGNHDSLPEAFNTPNSIRSDNGSNALSWNYQLLSSLWQQYGWINNASAQYAATHYGAYSTVTKQGLKIISINTDFWYVDNIFNFYSFTNPDVSGILTFLISELTASEAANQRVWIIGHVLSGYDGSNALPNPSALFYSIVRRFSPATIAGVFFGHTHEDQLMIYYDYAASSIGQSDLIRNTTDVDYNSPLAVGFIGPSITPLTGNNAGWQLYTVDAQTFEVLEIHTYFANVSNANTWTTPVWEFEYSARAVYDPHNTWPKTSPLNGTFWNGVTKNMLQNQTLVEQYNLLETKSSALTKNCSSAACAQQKVCYIRSGSAALGNACSQGNGPS